MSRAVWIIAPVALGLIAAPAPVAAQAMRELRPLPDDCRAFLPEPGRSGVQTWQAFVGMEHCDRVKRLRRLSGALPPEQRPLFFEGVVPAARLPPEFGVDVPVLRVVFPDRVFFDTARTELRPEADAIAGIVAESLRREPPDVALFVAGHADRRGDRQYNEALSIDRANSLAEAIFAKGVAFSSIWRIGFGQDMPLVGGDTAYAYDHNRRIEFLFAAKPEAVAIWMADQQQEELCQTPDRAAALRCKAGLRFRPDYYDAVQVRSPPRVRVQPSASEPHRIDPLAASRRPVAPAVGAPREVAVAGSTLIGVTPDGTRRIRIDPVNRRVPPVRVDL